MKFSKITESVWDSARDIDFNNNSFNFDEGWKQLDDLEWEIIDSGYGKKPIPEDNQKSYYVKSDTPGLRMWALYQRKDLESDILEDSLDEGKFSDFLNGVGDIVKDSADRAAQRKADRRNATADTLHKVANLFNKDTDSNNQSNDNVNSKNKKDIVNYTVSVTSSNGVKMVNSAGNRKEFAEFKDAEKFAKDLSSKIDKDCMAIVTDLDYGRYNVYKDGNLVKKTISDASSTKNDNKTDVSKDNITSNNKTEIDDKQLKKQSSNKESQVTVSLPQMEKTDIFKKYLLYYNDGNHFVKGFNSHKEAMAYAKELCKTFHVTLGVINRENKNYEFLDKNGELVKYNTKDKSNVKKKSSTDKKKLSNSKNSNVKKSNKIPKDVFEPDYRYWDDSAMESLNLKESNDMIVEDEKNDGDASWDFVLTDRKNDYDEYVMKAYKDGKYYEPATYYTDDWEDAVGTFMQTIKQYELKYRKSGKGYTTKGGDISVDEVDKKDVNNESLYDDANYGYEIIYENSVISSDYGYEDSEEANAEGWAEVEYIIANEEGYEDATMDDFEVNVFEPDTYDEQLTEGKSLNEDSSSQPLEFKAFITNLGKYNEGELVGEWVSFPIDEDEFEEVLERIGINSEDEFGQPYEEWFVTDYECNIPGFDWEDFGEYPSYERMNDFAEAIVNYDDPEALANAYEVTGDIQEAIDGLESGDIIYYPGIASEEDLGQYIINNLYGDVSELSRDMIERYFDYEALGRDLSFDSYELDNHRVDSITVTVTDIEVNDEPMDDISFEIDGEDLDLEIGDDVDEDDIENRVIESICDKYNCSSSDIDYSFDYDINWDNIVSAGEYWCGDEEASDYEIGEAYVNEVGFDGVGNVEYYFDYEAFGRDLTYENFTFTTDGCVETI